MDNITVLDTTTHIGAFEVTEPALAQLLAAHAPEDWPALVRRALAVGAHTLLTAGVAVDLGDVDTTVKRALADAAAQAEREVHELLATGRAILQEHLDPAHRDSLMGKALDDFRAWRDATLAGLDPDHNGSAAARLIAGLASQMEEFDARLTAALDPASDGSGFATLSTQMDVLFRELFAQIGRDHGRREEAQLGTAKGVDFEDVVEAGLRDVARSLGGCIVERTSRLGGQLGADVLVGDFVVTLPSGRRVVVEAKNKSRLSLHGSKGILVELDRARANRSAHFSVCVSAQPAFPEEVGPLGLYGDALLVVDDGQGGLLEPAIRWAAALADHRTDEDAVDAAAVMAAMDRIRSKARQLSDAKRALTAIGKSVAQVQDGLDSLRLDLLEVVEEISLGLRRDGEDARAA